MREVLQDVLLICTGRRFVICLVDWCRLAAKEKGESKDSPFFFIYELRDLEFSQKKASRTKYFTYWSATSGSKFAI